MTDVSTSWTELIWVTQIKVTHVELHTWREYTVACYFYVYWISDFCYFLSFWFTSAKQLSKEGEEEIEVESDEEITVGSEQEVEVGSQEEIGVESEEEAVVGSDEEIKIESEEATGIIAEACEAEKRSFIFE